MNAIQDAPVAATDPDINVDLGEGLQNGFDAIGKAFGGLVGAIKDAVGPELMKTLEVSTWLGQVAECLEKISNGLSSDGSVPAEPAGQFAFFVDQFDSNLNGSKLESQKPALQGHLQKCQQAIENAAADPAIAVATLSHSAGYFKAAAATCLPIQAKTQREDSAENSDG